MAVVVAITTTIGPTLVAFLLDARSAGFREAITKWRSFKRGIPITVALWIILFGWAIVETAYQEHADLVEANRQRKSEIVKRESGKQADAMTIQELTAQAIELKAENRRLGAPQAPQQQKEDPRQCWMADMQIPPSKQIEGPRSATQVIIHCNKKVDAPLEVVVVFDGDVIHSWVNIVGASVQMGGVETIVGRRTVRKAITAPTFLANHIIQVVAHGDKELPPKPIRGTVNSLQ